MRPCFSIKTIVMFWFLYLNLNFVSFSILQHSGSSGQWFVFLSQCKKTSVCLLRTEEIKVPRWSLVGSLNQYEKHRIEATYFTVCILVGFTTGAWCGRTRGVQWRRNTGDATTTCALPERRRWSGQPERRCGDGECYTSATRTIPEEHRGAHGTILPLSVRLRSYPQSAYLKQKIKNLWP